MRVLLAWLVGCGEVDREADLALPMEEVAPGIRLRVGAPDPLLLGEVNPVRVTGNLAPGEPVFLFASRASGPGPCSRVLGGACMSIRRPVLVDVARAANGQAFLDLAVPSSIPAGAPVWLQAVVVRGLGGQGTEFSTPISRPTYAPGMSVNPPGTVLVPTSDFVDPQPPPGWAQCAGFTNTADDDVTAAVLDGCLNTTRLRLRWWDDAGRLVEDVYDEALVPRASWPSFDYLGQGPMVRPLFSAWTSSTSFFVSTGGDACTFGGINAGHSLGNGDATQPNVSPADFDPAMELRISCGGPARLGHTVALYR